MDDLTEDRLRDDLSRCATYAAAPAPPVDALIRSGDAAARRRPVRWAVVGAAAAVAAVAVIAAVVNGGTSTVPDGKPPVVNSPSGTPSAPVPGAELPRVPYVEDGTLHLDGREFVIGETLLVATAPGTAVMVNPYPRHLNAVSIYRGETAVINAGSGVGVGVSPAGRYVWWRNEHDDRTAVTVWDAGAQRELGTREIPGSVSGPTGGGGDLEIVGVDDDGKLFWEVLRSEGRTLFVARQPEGSAQEVRGLGEDWWPATLTTAGLQIRGSFLSSRFEGETGTPYVTALLGPGGTWGECDDTGNCGDLIGGRTPAQASYSPDGTYAVFREEVLAKGGSRGIRIVRAHTPGSVYELVDLDLPEGAAHESLRFVGWEDDDTFLLVQGPPLSGQLVLRCEAGDGDCAVVLESKDERFRFAEDPLVG